MMHADVSSPGAPPSAPPRRWLDRPIWRFAVLGPPIGTLLYTLVLLTMGAREVLAQGTDSLPAWLAQLILLGGTSFLIFGYVFGLVPSVLTGLLAAWLGPRLRRRLQVPLLSAFGFVASYGFSRWIGHDTGVAWQMALCGAGSAAACALMGRRGAMAPPQPSP